MPSYYAAFFPDLSQHQWISDFRKYHDPKAQLVAPHITLINPTSKFSDADLRNEIRRVTRLTKKFSAVFRSALLMPETDQAGKHSAYIFLVPDEGFSAVLSLRNQLYAESLKSSLRLDIPFIPHITIASSLELDAAKKLVDILNSKPIEVPLLVDKISLVEIAQSQEDRKVIETFSLL